MQYKFGASRENGSGAVDIEEQSDKEAAIPPHVIQVADTRTISLVRDF
jgi:hypothetical protein